jgi:hypothetical protein
MKREVTTFPIHMLEQEFSRIEFPEYQREPSVWNLDQKQRLIDSILRSFDIAAIYLYERPDTGWECIDGRQRLNAIMSFLNKNTEDEDNGFTVKIRNEVSDETVPELARLNGQRFEALSDKDAILNYEVTVIVLSDAREASEFNLQFLRLNLGTLINAGEKLHAMVGEMRERLFEPGGLGQHPFLAGVDIPTRRYAHELLAAQLMLQASTRRESGQFTRARHFDLQRYLKRYADHEDTRLPEVKEALDALNDHASSLSGELGNRAIAVSVVLAGWELGIRRDAALAVRYGEFVAAFLERLRYQRERIKELDPDHRYDYLVTFQRDLTQAAVEKPAVTHRHDTLIKEFEVWSETGRLTGEDESETMIPSG